MQCGSAPSHRASEPRVTVHGRSAKRSMLLVLAAEQACEYPTATVVGLSMATAVLLVFALCTLLCLACGACKR
jgi:disulfide bond formation protein DsbB